MRVGGDHVAERLERDGEHLPRLRHPCRDEDTHPRQEVQLAEEAPGSVRDECLLAPVDLEEDVDHAGQDDVEVVVRVAGAVQVLPSADVPPCPERLERRELRCLQLRRGRGVEHETIQAAGTEEQTPRGPFDDGGAGPRRAAGPPRTGQRRSGIQR